MKSIQVYEGDGVKPAKATMEWRFVLRCTVPGDRKPYAIIKWGPAPIGSDSKVRPYPDGFTADLAKATSFKSERLALWVIKKAWIQAGTIVPSGYFLPRRKREPYDG